MRPRRAAALLALALASLAAVPAKPTTVVFCAPNYPGTTADAQPALDRFAAEVTRRASLESGAVTAVYHEREEAGLARLREAETVVAVVPFAFWTEHGESLGLVPRLQAVPLGSEPSETWSLVAARGAIRRAADLEGWEVVSIAGYAPRFVHGRALAAWGQIPSSARLVSSGQALSALRRASSGQRVAVLLDGAQSRSWPTLPFASQLEVVATSPAFPVSVVCSVTGRAGERVAERVLHALASLHDTPEGRAVLQELRLARFVPADPALRASGR